MKTKYGFLAIVFLMASYSFGQNKVDYRKLHYLSEEEMSMPLNTARDFIETDPPTGNVRNVAEFDQMQSVLVRYPFGVPISLIKEMAEDCEVITLVANNAEKQTVQNQYISAGVDTSNTSYIFTPTDSYWVRDYGPWFVFDGDLNAGIMDFPYNRPRPNDNNVPAAVASELGIDLYGMNVYHTGGNYMTTGMGQSASTDLVYDENPQLTEEQIADKISNYLGVDPYHVTMDPLDDYIKHIDCWGKYLSPGKVLVAEVPESDYRYQDYEDIANYFASQTSSWGKPYEVVRVMAPGTSPSTPYTNSLILNKKVFVPITGHPLDSAALQVYEDAMPGYEVIGIMYNGWMNTDALHCRTKGVADLGMLYIEHIPVLGNVAYQEEYQLSANIYNCSGQPVYNDSVFVYYSINGGDYQHSNMSFEGDYEWTGSISGIAPGDEIDYYLYAADWSGRRSTHPFIGQPDPHEFKPFGSGQDQISTNPDTVLFLTYQQMEDGIQLKIANIAPGQTTLTSLSEYGETFPWYVENMPAFPYIMEMADTLSLNIKCDIPVQFDPQLLIDTMFISTLAKTYNQLIAIDINLLSANSAKADEIKVYPNPFSNNIYFEYNSANNESFELNIYSISGKLVYHKNNIKQSATGQNRFMLSAEENQLVDGIYFYEIKEGAKIKSGKIVLKR